MKSTSPSDAAPLRAVIYARRSQKAEHVQSVDEQAEHCRRLAKVNGYHVVADLADDGISGWKEGVRRPAWESVQALVASDQVDVVVAASGDRLSRSEMLPWLEFLNLCARHAVNLHTVSGGFERTDEQIHQLLSLLRNVTANAESNEKSERLKRGSETRALAGRPSGAGVRPLGWRRSRGEGNRTVWEVDETEAELVRQAYQRVLTGGSTKAIARAWNALGMRTPEAESPGRGTRVVGGRYWNHSKVRALLLLPRYAGLVVHRGEILEGVTGLWEPLVSEEMYRDVRATLEARAGERGNNSVHLLSGIARCWCGEPVRPSLSGRNKDRRYRCGRDVPRREGRTTDESMSHSTVSRDVLDEAVTAAVVRELLHLPTDRLAGPGEAGAIAALTAQLTEVRSRVGHLVDAVADGHLSGSDVLAKRQALEAEAAAIDRQLNDARASNAAGALVFDARAQLWAGATVSIADAAKVREELGQRFAELPVERRRALIRSTVAVTVLPQNVRGRANRIEIASLSDRDVPELPEGEILEHAPFGSEVPA